MPQPVLLTPDEREAFLKLGQRLRAARLRRNMSQDALAKRAGISRKTLVSLEAGKPTVNLSVLVKVVGIFGYLERITDLMLLDPIGEEEAISSGRQRASRQADVADF